MCTISFITIFIEGNSAMKNKLFKYSFGLLVAMGLATSVFASDDEVHTPIEKVATGLVKSAIHEQGATTINNLADGLVEHLPYGEGVKVTFNAAARAMGAQDLGHYVMDVQFGDEKDGKRKVTIDGKETELKNDHPFLDLVSSALTIGCNVVGAGELPRRVQLATQREDSDTLIRWAQGIKNETTEESNPNVTTEEKEDDNIQKAGVKTTIAAETIKLGLKYALPGIGSVIINSAEYGANSLGYEYLTQALIANKKAEDTELMQVPELHDDLKKLVGFDVATDDFTKNILPTMFGGFTPFDYEGYQVTFSDGELPGSWRVGTRNNFNPQPYSFASNIDTGDIDVTFRYTNVNRNAYNGYLGSWLVEPGAEKFFTLQLSKK